MIREIHDISESNLLDDFQLSEMLNEMQNDIMQKIAHVAKYKKKMEYFFYDNEQEQIEQYHAKADYYSEFWRIFLINEIMISQIKELNNITKNLHDKVQDIDVSMEKYFELLKSKNKKKNRRLATEITKDFKCPYENCYKIYGTQVSLNLHMKLKHNGGNKTQRQALAKQYINALDKKLPLPPLTLSFPPGYLEEFRRTMSK